MGKKALLPSGKEFLPDVTKRRLQGLLRREKDPKAATKLRACIMRKEGSTVNEIRTKLGIQYQYTYAWLRRVSQNGIDAIYSKASGAKALISDEEQGRLLEDLAAAPKKCGYDADAWDSQLVLEHIAAKYGQAYTKSGVRSMLQRLEFALPPAKPRTPKGAKFMPGVTKKRMEKLLEQEKVPKAITRLRAYILRKEGKSMREIGEEIGRDYSIIRYWLKRASEEGLAVRHDAKQGSKPKLVEEQIKQVRKDLGSSPTRYGFRSHVWSREMLREHIRKKYGVDYSSTSVFYLLRKLDFSLRTQMFGTGSDGGK